MILDSGLDNACTTQAQQAAGFQSFVAWAAIGTGSTPPDAADLLLEAQHGSRSNNNGGFSDLNDAAQDTGNNLIFVEQEFTRVFNISASVTIREWGLAPANTGNLSARDLFRDLSNNPTAIPLEDGDQLQLVIRLRVQAAWEYEAASFVITGAPGRDSAGTHDGVATVSSGAATTYDAIRDTLRAVWPGGSGSSNHAPALRALLSSQAGRTKSQDLTDLSGPIPQSASSYTAGSHFRDWSAAASPSDLVGDHHGWVSSLTGTTWSQTGYRFLLTDPQFLTKTDTERLTLTVRKHIARA